MAEVFTDTAWIMFIVRHLAERGYERAPAFNELLILLRDHENERLDRWISRQQPDDLVMDVDLFLQRAKLRPARPPSVGSKRSVPSEPRREQTVGGAPRLPLA